MATAPSLSSETARNNSSPTIKWPWKRLLLPAEHGSWSLTFEPVALGLLVAPSPASVAIGFTVLAVFLARKPFRLAGGKSAASDLAILRAAALLVICFSLAAFAALALAVFLSGPRLLFPFLVAAPGLAFFAWCDRAGQTRSASAEAIGTGLCALPAVSMVLASPLPLEIAVAVGLLVLSRSLPTLILVRTFLRRSRGASVSEFPVHVAHGGALTVVIVVSILLHLPWTVPVVNALLFLRALMLLAQQEKRWTGKQVGILETFVGLGHTAAQGLALVFR